MNPPRAGQGAFVFVFVTVLIDSIGFGIILPVLPRLIMELTGVGIDRAATYGGVLAFVYALMQFFCAPVLGNLSDAYGRRPVLLFALGALGCDYFIMGFAPTIAWLFVGRTIAGVAGASFTPAYAYIADITPAEKRAQSFGLMGAAFGVGFIVGPAIGGLLGDFGPRAPFFAAGALALANTVFGLVQLPESLPLSARRPFHWVRANPLGTLAHFRRYPAVAWLLGALFLWQLGHQVLPSTWAFYTISKFGWTSAQVGWSLAWVGALMATAQGLLTRVLIPFLGGERRAALVGMAAAVIAYVGYACATRGWMVYAFSLTTFVFALTYPSMNAIASQRTPANAQGELQGAVACLYSLSAIVGPILMTQIFGYFSSARAPVHFPGAAFLTAALLTVGSAALFVKALRRTAHGATVLALAVLGCCGVLRAAQAAELPPVRHVFVIVLENESFESTFAEHSKAPYLSRTLLRQGALLSQYHGIGHYSLDNYLALISGQAPNDATQMDCPIFSEFRATASELDAHGQLHGAGCVYPATAKTLPDQLEAAGLTWRAYMEDMGNDPARERASCGHAQVGSEDPTIEATPVDAYAAKHDPFVYFHGIIDDPARCDTHVVNLRHLAHDLAHAAATPNFVFITPNLCSDGHDDPCADGRVGGLAGIDRFLSEWVPQILRAPAFRADGMLVVTFDEAGTLRGAGSAACCNERGLPGAEYPPGLTGPGGGRVGAVVLSPFVHPGTVSAEPYNHYALLATIETLFGLKRLGYAGEPDLRIFGADVFSGAAPRPRAQ